MIKHTHIIEYAQQLFAREEEAAQAANFLHAFLKACSAHLTDVARKMPSDSKHPETKYKALQRFLQRVDAKAVLWRLFQPDAPFVLCDVNGGRAASGAPHGAG